MAVQATALATAGVDFLFAATLPNTDEALGMAHAMAACRIPYVVSFVLQRDGRLLDGIPLHQAVATIDEAASPRPLFYMANCVHPQVFEAALASEISRARRRPRAGDRPAGEYLDAESGRTGRSRRGGPGRGARGARRRDAPAAPSVRHQGPRRLLRDR